MLHEPVQLFHRDIRWPNIIRSLDELDEWFIIDWEDASTQPTKARPRFDSTTHSPKIFEDGHGPEVDLWGVGELILSCSALDITPTLKELGRWMKGESAPSASEALEKIKQYKESLSKTGP